MGFSFSGMMKGLGTGLVSTGALMEEYNKRKFEEEQLKAKLDREEHMQRLQLQAQKDMQQQGFTHAETLQKQGFSHAENLTAMEMKQQQENADRAYGLDMQRLKGEQSERAANTKYRSEQAAREKEIYDMKLQELKDRDAAIEETSKMLYPDDPKKQKVYTNLQKGYIQVTGKDKIGSEAVSKAIDTASILVEKIPDKDIPNEAKSLNLPTKDKSVSALRSSITAVMANEIAETASGGSGGGMLSIPGETAKSKPIGTDVNSETLLDTIRTAPDQGKAQAALAKAQRDINLAMQVEGADVKALRDLLSQAKRTYDSRFKTTTFTHTPMVSPDEWNNPSSNTLK